MAPRLKINKVTVTFQRFPLANPERVRALCRLLDSWWQELIDHEQTVAEITYEGHLAMRAELERVYQPMREFVTEFVYENPQRVPDYASMEDFMARYFEPEGHRRVVEQVNEDGIPVDLIFPDTFL